MDNGILMSADMLQKIAKLLGTSVDFLLYGKEEDLEGKLREIVRAVVREEIVKQGRDH